MPKEITSRMNKFGLLLIWAYCFLILTNVHIVVCPFVGTLIPEIKLQRIDAFKLTYRYYIVDEIPEWIVDKESLKNIILSPTRNQIPV
jgi:hypothetical protein